MNPFVAIAAAIITFAAFWTQYQANQEMQKNSYTMQFERQFYEMLKIHCDNVKNLHAESSLESEHPVRKAAEGREYFSCLLEEFNLIYEKIEKSEGTIDIFNKTYRIFFFGIDLMANHLKKETVEFFRILRAQLSSAEQTLLYYNWKSGYGKQWEEDSTKPGSNHFFTDYRMIHNIIPKDCWAFSSDEILQSLLEKKTDYEKLNGEDTLFELIDEKGT